MKNIFVLTNYTKDPDYSVTKRLAQKLLDIGCNVALSEKAHDICKINNALIIEKGLALKDTDLIAVVGGDGSILDASQEAIANDIPVLGINTGRLGYLSGMDPSDIDRLNEILSGNYHERSLMTLSIKILSQNESVEISSVRSKKL